MDRETERETERDNDRDRETKRQKKTRESERANLQVGPAAGRVGLVGARPPQRVHNLRKWAIFKVAGIS